MSETRRDLFKTSVLSGLGLMSASALAACAGGPHPLTGPNDYVAGYDAAHSVWYLFVSNSTGTYDVSYLPSGSAFAPPAPSANVLFDVNTWSKAPGAGFIPAPKSFVTVGGVPITITAAHQTDGPSTKELQKHLHPLTCSWNEIAP